VFSVQELGERGSQAEEGGGGVNDLVVLTKKSKTWRTRLRVIFRKSTNGRTPVRERRKKLGHDGMAWSSKISRRPSMKRRK